MNYNLEKFESDPYNGTKINYPLSEFLRTNVNKKIGLALGHGDIYNHDVLLNVEQIDIWYTLDIDSKAYPDYICDITNIKSTNYLPDNTFDCILSAHIPVGILRKKYFRALNNLKRVLKQDGQLVTTEFPDLYFWFLSSKQMKTLTDKLVRNIKNTGNQNKFFDYLKTFDYKLIKGLPMDKKMFSLYNCFCHEYNSMFIKKIEYDYTRQLFRKNGFVVAKKNRTYLYWYRTNLR